MDAASLLAANKELPEAAIQFNGGTVKLRALPRREYRDLLDAHAGEGDADWDDDFQPALIAACAVEPEFTVEQAREAWEEWTEFDADRLFLTAFHLNESPPAVALGFTLPGSALISGSGQNSTTAPTEESPTPSS